MWGVVQCDYACGVYAYICGVRPWGVCVRCGAWKCVSMGVGCMRVGSVCVCVCEKTSRTDSLEPSVDKRPTEEGGKGREEVLAIWTGGRETEQWRGSPPGKAELLSLTCKGEGARLCEF